MHLGCNELDWRRNTFSIAELGWNRNLVAALRQHSDLRVGAEATRSLCEPRATSSQSLRRWLSVQFHARTGFEQRTASWQPERRDCARDVDQGAYSSRVHRCWHGPRAAHRVPDRYRRRGSQGFIETLWKSIGKCYCSLSGKRPESV